jgi:hypothetical protein
MTQHNQNPSDSNPDHSDSFSNDAENPWLTVEVSPIFNSLMLPANDDGADLSDVFEPYQAPAAYGAFVLNPRKDHGASLSDNYHPEKLWTMAREELPHRPAIDKVLRYVSNVELMGLLSARVLAEEFGNSISNRTLDKMIAAALLTEAHNLEKIVIYFDNATLNIVDELLDLTEIEDGKELIEAIHALSTPAKRVFFAGTIGEIEELSSAIARGTGDMPSTAQMKDLAIFLRNIAAVDTAAIDKIDTCLIDRTILAFNNLAKTAKYPMSLYRGEGQNAISMATHRQQSQKNRIFPPKS